jgi:hypothetical protein
LDFYQVFAATDTFPDPTISAVTTETGHDEVARAAQSLERLSLSSQGRS